MLGADSRPSTIAGLETWNRKGRQGCGAFLGVAAGSACHTSCVCQIKNCGKLYVVILAAELPGVPFVVMVGMVVDCCRRLRSGLLTLYFNSFHRQQLVFRCHLWQRSISPMSPRTSQNRPDDANGGYVCVSERFRRMGIAKRMLVQVQLQLSQRAQQPLATWHSNRGP